MGIQENPPPEILRFPNTSQNFELKVPTVIVLDFKGKPPEHATVRISDWTQESAIDLQTTSFDIPWFLGLKKDMFFSWPGKVDRKKWLNKKTSKAK